MLNIGSFDRMIQVCSMITSSETDGGILYDISGGFSEYAFVEWKDGKSSESDNGNLVEQTVEFTIRNISIQQKRVTGNSHIIKFPMGAGGIEIGGETQYYTIVGTRIWGGREKYKTLICDINTNISQTS